MKRIILLSLLIGTSGSVLSQESSKEMGVSQEKPLSFKTVSIDENFPLGYQIKVADINADGALDIVALREGDEGLVAWYENPSWTPHRITPKTVSRPVSLALRDIDNDGDLDSTLAHEFNYQDSVEKGSVSWFEQGEDAAAEWTPHLIDREPMQHRVLWVDLDGDGKDELISAPLLGFKSTPADTIFAPVRIKRSEVPSDPKNSPWPTTILYDRLRAMHGMMKLSAQNAKRDSLLTASYEGLSILRLNKEGKAECALWHEGHQGEGAAKGSSEIALGTIGDETFYAAIEPRHGNVLAIYQGDVRAVDSAKPERKVIDDQIQVGHGLLCADLDADGISEILVGDRGEKKSYYLYRAANSTASSWEKIMLDDGGLAGADCAVGDMDGDSDLDIVAVGSATGNVRMYVNQIKP